MSNTVTVSTSGGSVTTVELEEGATTTVSDLLEAQGIDASSVSLMHNGQATTLDQVLNAGDRVTAMSGAKGAS